MLLSIIVLRLEEVGLGIIGRNDHKTDGTDVNQYALLLFTMLCNYNALQERANVSIAVSRLYFLNIPGRQRNDRPINILIFEGASSVDTPTSCGRNNRSNALCSARMFLLAIAL